MSQHSHRNATLSAVMTHDEVAAALCLSRQRIVQLEASALRKLRRNVLLRELFFEDPTRPLELVRRQP